MLEKYFLMASEVMRHIYVLGLIVGAIIRYSFSMTTLSHIEVSPNNVTIVSRSVPPDEVWLWFPDIEKKNKTFSYKFHGEVTDLKNNEMDIKVLFNVF